MVAIPSSTQPEMVNACVKLILVLFSHKVSLIYPSLYVVLQIVIAGHCLCLSFLSLNVFSYMEQSFSGIVESIVCLGFRYVKLMKYTLDNEVDDMCKAPCLISSI